MKLFVRLFICLAILGVIWAFLDTASKGDAVALRDFLQSIEDFFQGIWDAIRRAF